MFARLSSELCTLSAMSCPSSVGSMWMLYVDSFFFFLAISWPLPCSCPQRWQKSGTHLEHLVSRFCLDSEMALDGMDSSRMLVISPCELSAYTQRWEVPFSWPPTPWPFTSQRNLPRHPSQPQRPGQRQLLWQSEDAWARHVEELQWRQLDGNV